MLANRRYLGLAFAFAMAWHVGFVSYLIWSFGNPLNVKATLMDVTGFIFLLLMTLTSFRWGARYLSRANWRRLHKMGIYAIWLVATLIYFHAVRVGAGLMYRAFLGVLLVAWMLRVTAWRRLRLSRRQPEFPRTREFDVGVRMDADRAHCHLQECQLSGKADQIPASQR